MKPEEHSTKLRTLLQTAVVAFCLLMHVSWVFPAEGAVPRVSEGYRLPAGVELTAARGTGQTTGHIATLTIENNSSQPFEMPAQMFYIPSDGRFQGYVAWPVPGQIVPPGATQDVPVEGYCSSVHKPPVPADESLPPPEDWIVPTGESGPVEIPAVDNPVAPGLALVPGTDNPLPRAVSVDDEPETAVPLLLAAIEKIQQATTELQESGELVTPFSSNPDREREAVNQQTFWLFVSELENEPYTREDFTERLETQYEDRTGIPVAEASDEDRERLEQGADDFWDAFELVGAEAKVINVSGAAAGTTEEAKTEAQPGAVAAPPPEETVELGCKYTDSIRHSPRVVQAEVADSYGDDDSRKKITEGIRAAVASESNAYATTTPPATAYAIWRDDHIGGISSAYAKTVFLEDKGQDWVWSTDPMTTLANGNGVHTLAFEHGPECSAVVAGAASMWIKASSDAFDPLERNIEFFRALDAIKEVSVKYLSEKLPPGLGDALEEGVGAITDPASDTYAGATGSATLTVGDKTKADSSVNRVVYKREDKEDKAIVGGGETIRKFNVADQKPDALTSRIEASAKLEAGATGNGTAEAHLESLYGTILIGVCECPNGTLYKVLSDTSQFIRSEAAQTAVNRAMQEMQQAADRIGKAIESGEQKTDGASLQRRAEGELGSWARSIGGDRFEPKAEEGSETASQ